MKRKIKRDYGGGIPESTSEIEIEHSVIPTADHVWDQKMTAALSAGTGPDVIQMSPDYYGFYIQNTRGPEPMWKKKGGLNSVARGHDRAVLSPGLKAGGNALLENVFVLAYNKDKFDQFGVEYPAADWTWDDLAEAAKKFVAEREQMPHTAW